MSTPLAAPPNTRCLYCGQDASGSWIRKAIYEPDPDTADCGYEFGRIKLVGFGWQCANECNPIVYEQGNLF